MGVVGGITRIPETELQRLASTPGELAWYLDGWTPRASRGGLLDRILGRRRAEAVQPERQWVPPPPEASQYLDKAWHAIHFLFTGTAAPSEGPEAFLLSGRAVPAGEYEVLVHFAAEVQEIAAAIGSHTHESLSQRFDAEAMRATGVYLFDRSATLDESLAEYVLDYALEVIEFVVTSAKRGDGMVVSING